jgi:SNF2 family DNA or RNA helicase
LQNIDLDQFVSNLDTEEKDLSSIDDKYNCLLNAYALTGTAKAKGVVEFLETLLESKVKFLVFAHHYEVMDMIEDAVVKRKVSYIRIDGQIEATKRYQAVNKF